MSAQSHVSSASTIVSGMLGVLFVGLKLCHVIDWSWWWVTAPFWGGVALAAVILAAIGVFALFCLIIAALTGQIPSKRKTGDGR